MFRGKIWLVVLFLCLCILGPNSYVYSLQVDEDEQHPSRISRLSSHEEHVGALENAFKRAKSSIIVTNYGALYPNILKTRLFTTSIPEACQRNVQVYFRLNYTDGKSDYPAISSGVEQYFAKHGINVARIKTHAKIVSVDHELVMIGSFNWLTELTSPYNPKPYNATFVYEGPQAYKMTEDMWGVLIYYRNKEFLDYRANHRRAFLFKRNPNNQVSKEYHFEDGSTLTYVPVIEEHRRKILDIFEVAKRNITILSPFVSWDGVNTYQRDFVHKLISTVLERGVSVCFVCLRDHLNRFSTYLGDLLQYPNLKVIGSSHLHAKTIIRDDNLIGEGSFNWLCASRDEVTDAHKHEATLIYEGPQAKEFIDSFYQSEPGRLVSRALSVDALPQKTKKRKLHRKSSQDEIKTPSHSEESEEACFSHLRMGLERDIWGHDPFWIEHSPGYTSRVYGRYFEVLSGERVGRQGFCVRVNKRYLTDNSDNIIYYDSQKKAKDATFDLRSE